MLRSPKLKPSSQTKIELELPEEMPPTRGVKHNSSFRTECTDLTDLSSHSVVKGVTFNPRVKVQTIQCPPKDKLWYSSEDYEDFKHGMAGNLEAFQDFCDDVDDRVCNHEEYCTRGLELYISREGEEFVEARMRAALRGEDPAILTKLSGVAVAKALERADFDRKVAGH